MVFVAIETGVYFLYLPGIDIFLTKLVGLLFQGFRRLACFDLRVFLTAVALTRHLNDAGIDYLSIFSKDALIIEGLMEPEKQRFNKLCLYQYFPEFPDSFAFRHFVTDLQPQKSSEAHSIGNLILHLVIGQAVQSLQNEHLEHHQLVERRPARVLAFFGLVERYIENRRKELPINLPFKLDEQIFMFGEAFEQILFVKHAERSDVFHSSTIGLMGTVLNTYISIPYIASDFLKMPFKDSGKYTICIIAGIFNVTQSC
jgi:hypothetical protein